MYKCREFLHTFKPAMPRQPIEIHLSEGPDFGNCVIYSQFENMRVESEKMLKQRDCVFLKVDALE